MGFFDLKTEDELEAELAAEKKKADKRVKRKKLEQEIKKQRSRGKDDDDEWDVSAGPLSVRGPKW